MILTCEEEFSFLREKTSIKFKQKGSCWKEQVEFLCKGEYISLSVIVSVSVDLLTQVSMTREFDCLVQLGEVF